MTSTKKIIWRTNTRTVYWYDGHAIDSYRCISLYISFRCCLSCSIDNTQNNGTSICLGDFGSVFGCQLPLAGSSYTRRTDSRNDRNDPRRKKSHDGVNSFSSIKSCSTVDVVKNKFRCEVMIKRSVFKFIDKRKYVFVYAAFLFCFRCLSIFFSSALFVLRLIKDQ